MGEMDSGSSKEMGLRRILELHKSLIQSIGPDAEESLGDALDRADAGIQSLPPEMRDGALDAWATLSERELMRVSGMPARNRGGEFARALSAMDFLSGKITGAQTKAAQWIEIAKTCLRPADLVDSITSPPSSRPEQLIITEGVRDDGTAAALISQFNENKEELPYWLQNFFLSIPDDWFKGISREDIAECFYSSRTHPLDPMGKLNEVLAPMGVAMYPIVRGKAVERLKLAHVSHTITSGSGEFLKGYVTDDEGLVKDADGYLDPVMFRIYVRGTMDRGRLSGDARHAYFHERQHLFDLLSGYSAKVNRMEDMERKRAFIEATAYARDSTSRLEDMEDVHPVGARLRSIGEKNKIQQPFKELQALIESSGPDRQKAARALRECIDGKYSAVLGISFSEIFGSVL